MLPKSGTTTQDEVLEDLKNRDETLHAEFLQAFESKLKKEGRYDELKTMKKKGAHASNKGTGWIQSYGVMIVVDEEENFKVQACSANSLDLLGVDFEQIVGSCLFSFFDGEDLKKLKGICEQQSSSFLNPSLINFGIPGGPKAMCSLIVSRRAKSMFLELIPGEEVHEGMWMSHSRARTSIVKLQLSTSMTTLFEVAVHELWQVSGFDRAMLYRFDESDMHGVVVEERMTSVVPSSYKGMHFPATDIPIQTRDNFFMAGQRLIASVDSVGSPLMTREDFPVPDLSLTHLRAVHPCHQAYLQNMGVKATLVLSIQVDGKLWGLFVFHHYSGDKVLPYQTCTACEFLARAFSIRLASMLQEELHVRKENFDECQSELCRRIAREQDVVKGLTMTEGNMDMTSIIQGAVGACVVKKGSIVGTGKYPPPEIIRRIHNWADSSKSDSKDAEAMRPMNMAAHYRTKSSDNIKALLELGDEGDYPAGVLVSRMKEGFMMWFRDAVHQTINWAGDPNDTGGVFTPRASFDIFVVESKGRCKQWSTVDYQEAETFSLLIDDISLTVSGMLSSDMLLRLNQERMENRSKCAALSAELVGLIENANAPIFAVDPLGTITRWNRKTAVLTGIPCHEAMGSHMDDLLKCSKDALDTIKATMTKSIMGHRVDPFQMVLISRGGLDGFEETIKEGDELLFFVGPNVSRDLTGRARDVLFVGQDVTDVRKTMVKCLEIEAGYQRVIAESGSPIFGVSTDGSITDWNCATEAITKISSKTALGMPFLGKSGVFGGLLPLLHNGVETELEVFVSTTLEAAGLKTPQIKDKKGDSVEAVDKAKDSHFEFSFIDSAGATIDFMIMATCPKTGSEDNLAQKSIVFFALNITEKRALQAANVAYIAAEAASNAKTDQIGFLCHELRNPLNGVMGNISLLEECGLGENEAELVDSTLQCCTQLMRIMNDVLDMSKVEQGKLEIERIVFDISKIVDAVTSQIRIAAEGKNIQVEVIYSGFDKAGHYFLESDPVRVQQIISNFAWNAIKFTESGKIIIRVLSQPCEIAKDDPEMHTVTISVTDTGVGISRTSINKLFQPYTQAEKSTSRQYGGTGLGLSICKQLAHLLGGKVGVESTVGKGSMFYLTLHEKMVGKPVDEKCLSITSQAPRWRPDRGSRPASQSPSPVGQLLPLTEATERKDAGGDIDQVLNTGPSFRRKKVVDWSTEDQHETAVHMTMLDLGVTPEAVLTLLDPKWSSKVVRESRDGDSLMVLLEVSCDGATRQHWGSSALKGGQAYVEATNDAIKNVAAIFCKTSAAGAKLDPNGSSDGSSQVDRASSAQSSRLSPLAARMMSPSKIPQQVLKSKETSPSQSDSTESVSSRESRKDNSYSCLLVDDDRINIRILDKALSRAGFTCVNASDGSQLLPLLKDGSKFDIVLIDENMKRMNGTVAARQVRNWERETNATSYLPLILVTGESSCISRHVKMSGLDGVIVKPINIKNIGDSLKDYIEHMHLNPPATGTECNVDDCSTYQMGSISIFNHPVFDITVAQRSYPLVLAVDDEPNNNRLIERTLQQHMFRVQCLTDGCELLPKLKEIGFKCQLILLDEMMKKTNGTTAARELRAYEEENGLPHTPIISLTANATTQDLDRYNNAGINGIILKPFDVKQLASSMNAFLDLASKGTPNTVQKRMIGCATIFARVPGNKSLGGTTPHGSCENLEKAKAGSN